MTQENDDDDSTTIAAAINLTSGHILTNLIGFLLLVGVYIYDTRRWWIIGPRFFCEHKHTTIHTIHYDAKKNKKMWLFHNSRIYLLTYFVTSFLLPLRTQTTYLLPHPLTLTTTTTTTN